MPIQYSVPQFIDVENKILGPIAVRQFIMLAVAVGLIIGFYKFTDFSFFIFATVIILLVTIVIAFVKVNGRPFHFFMLNIMQSIRNPHLRVWKKDSFTPIKKNAAKNKKKETAQINYIKIAKSKRKSRSHISELSLLVDTGGYLKS